MYNLRSKEYSIVSTVTEEVWSVIEIDKDVYVIGAVYVPPSSPLALYEAHVASINNVLDKFPKCKVLILGDFNLRNYSNGFRSMDANEWFVNENQEHLLSFVNDNVNNVYFSSTNQCERLLYDCVNFYDLAQLNHVKNSNGVILDFVFSNFQGVLVHESSGGMVKIDSQHPPLDISCGILLSGDTSGHFAGDPFITNEFNYARADFAGLNDYFEGTDWSFIQHSASTDEVLEIFYMVLYIGVEAYVPRKKVRSIKYPTYFSRKSINLLNKKNKAFRKWRMTCRSVEDEVIHNKYIVLRAMTKKSIDIDYNNFVSSVQTRIMRNVRVFWSYVRSKRSGTGFPGHMHYDGRKSDNLNDIVALFAEFFLSVYSDGGGDVDCGNYYDYYIESDVNLSRIEFGSDKVFDKLVNLDCGKGPGPDGIPPLFYRGCSPSLALPISEIFQLSHDKGCFPKIWKAAYVTPIFKGGDKGEVRNYRPISGLNCLGKICESIMADELKFVFKSIISEDQHGFVSARSCQTNLSVFANHLARIIDSNGQVDCIYFDFKKAFDRVDHSRLICKLHAYGIGCPLLSVLKSYLTDRTQKIKINNVISDTINVQSGVPQGSHLGPILFLAFIDDVKYVINDSKSLNFADDKKVYKTIDTETDCSALQRDIDNLVNWCGLNKLELNIDKCKVITFSRKLKTINFNYHIDGQQISRVSIMRDLGVMFDSGLSFCDHINDAVAKANRMLGFVLRQCWDFTDVEAIKCLYYALVRSHLEYGCVVWCPFYRVYIDRIEQVQHRFVRFLLCKLGISGINLTYQDRLNALGIESLESRRNLLSLAFMHRILTDTVDCNVLLSMFNFKVPTYRTKSINTFYKNKSRTNIGKNSVSNRLMELYDKYIPTDFNLDCKPAAFKHRLKRILNSNF